MNLYADGIRYMIDDILFSSRFNGTYFDNLDYDDWLEYITVFDPRNKDGTLLLFRPVLKANPKLFIHIEVEVPKRFHTLELKLLLKLL